MYNTIKIEDLPNGSIVWKGNTILGIKGLTLDSKYNNRYCNSISGNDKDYELAKEE